MTYLAGEDVTADELNGGTTMFSSSTDTVAGTTTSTSFTGTLTGTTAKTLAFIAPPSGKIAVTVSAEIALNSATGLPAYATIAAALSGAAGVQAATDNKAAFIYATAANTRSGLSRRALFTGLTAGQAGLVTLQHRVTASTGTFNFRTIDIEYVA